MAVDRRFVIVLVAVLLLIVVVALARGPIGFGNGVDGPDGGCPPGHVTSTGCAKP